MTDHLLFSNGHPRPDNPLPPGAAPRFLVPDRHQVEMLCTDLDSLIPFGHPVRIIWEYVCQADLSALFATARSVEGHPGRPAADPRVALALWMYATLQGVGSGRALDRLCSAHIAYRWICGHVPTNYHSLDSFRSRNAALFKQIMIEGVARLMAAKLVTLEFVAHDGLRVRANAGTKSFRGLDTLEKCRAEATAQVEALERESQGDPATASERQKAAAQRAAREQADRVAEALRQYPDVLAKKKDKKKKARVSTTDPDARIMKMPDGGFRPAYNVQFSADVGSQIIVGVDVIQSGSDHGQLVPAVETIQEQTGRVPDNMLADGGFAKPEDIQKLSEKCTVYAPPTEHKDKHGNVLEPKGSAGPGEDAWRARMKDPATKEIYGRRASTIECVNALARNRGLYQMPVRRLERVKAVVLLFAVVHNLMREHSLMRERAERAGKPGTG